MTISSEIRTAGPFSGNGVTYEFPFDFKVFKAEDLYVVVAPEGGDGELPLELGTDYTVVLNPDQNAAPGGKIVTHSPLPVGAALTATSALDYLQPVDLTNQGGFYPRVINDGLDRLTIFAQQLGEGLGRALQAPLSDGGGNVQLPARNARKGTVLAFHEETGAPIAGPSIATVNTVADAIGKVNTVADNITDVNTVADNITDVNTVADNIADVNTVADNIADVNTVADNIAVVNTVADNIADVSNFADVYYGPSATDPTARRDGSPLQPGDLYYNLTGGMRVYSELGTWIELPLSANMANVTFSGDGVTTDFQLPYAPGTKANMWVFISGVYQQKETFDAEGDVLKFASPPPAGADNIEVVMLAVTQSDALNSNVLYVDTVEDLKAITSPALKQGRLVRTLGYHTPGDGGGCDYEIVAAGTGSNYGFLYEQLSGSGLEAKLLGGGIMEDKTVYIPTDYGTLQEAIDDLSKLRVKQGVTITLTIESGHNPSRGISVSSGHYGHFVIAAEDSIVSFDGAFVGVVVDAINATAPVLGCLIDLGGGGGYAAYSVSDASSGRVLEGCGIINGSGRGLYVNHASNCIAVGAIFTGFQDAGLHVSRSSNCEAADADFSSNGLSGGSFGAVYASRNSRINGANMNVQNSGGTAIRAQRMAVITCPDCNVSGSASYAVLATLGGKVYSSSGPLIALNLLGPAVAAQNGGIVSLPYAQFSSASGYSGTAIEVRSASTADLSSATVEGFAGNVLYALEASMVNARGVSINGGVTLIRAEQGAVINARGAIVSGASGTGVLADRGAQIIINDGAVTGSGGKDLSVQSGSTICAGGCTTTNGPGSPNIADTNLVGGFNFANNNNRGFIWT